MDRELYDKAINAIYNGKTFGFFYLGLRGEYDRNEAKTAYEKALNDLNSSAKANGGKGYGNFEDNDKDIELNENIIRNIVSDIMHNLL